MEASVTADFQGFLDRVSNAKTQADYTAAYTEFNAWYQPQLKANTWPAPESVTASNLGMWLKMLSEEGVREEWVAGLTDSVRLFKHARQIA